MRRFIAIGLILIKCRGASENRSQEWRATLDIMASSERHLSCRNRAMSSLISQHAHSLQLAVSGSVAR